jgi:hypothetical protein
MVLATIFQIVIRLLSLARFLVTSQGDAHPNWSQMLTPKMKPLFRLNFVGDIMVIGRILKLLLCFFLIAEKISEFGSVKKMAKYQISVVWASLQRAH